jgi:hypothetical protein
MKISFNLFWILFAVFMLSGVLSAPTYSYASDELGKLKLCYDEEKEASTNSRDIPGETTQGWHHGSENLTQFFSTDSPIKLKKKSRKPKLSKTKTRIFTAY